MTNNIQHKNLQFRNMNDNILDDLKSNSIKIISRGCGKNISDNVLGDQKVNTLNSLMSINIPKRSSKTASESSSPYDDSFTANNSEDPCYSKSKRKSSGADTESDSKPRKRFVWPEALHRDFVIAVFDVGLKSASPKAIIDLLPSSQALTTEHIKSHLQKFRVHRDRSREEFVSHYELSVQSGRISFGNNYSDQSKDNCNIGTDFDHFASGNSGMTYAALTMLRRQYDLLDTTISVQSTFQSSLNKSIVDQKKLKLGIAKRIVQLDPTIKLESLSGEETSLQDLTATDRCDTMSGHRSSSPPLSHPTCATNSNNSSNNNSCNNNPAILMVSEMQSLKCVHSLLNKRKETQMAPFISCHHHHSHMTNVQQQFPIQHHSDSSTIWSIEADHSHIRSTNNTNNITSADNSDNTQIIYNDNNFNEESNDFRSAPNIAVNTTAYTPAEQDDMLAYYPEHHPPYPLYAHTQEDDEGGNMVDSDLFDFLFDAVEES